MKVMRLRFYAPDGDGAAQPQPDEPKKEEPRQEEPKTPETPDTQAFLEQLNQLASLITTNPQPAEPVKKDDEPSPSGKTDVNIPEDPDEFSSFVSDPTKFNSFIQSLTQKVKEETKNEILRTIPQELKKAVKEEISFDRAASDFWIDNPDLLPARQFLAARATIIASRNPDLSYSEVFKKAGKEVRDSLKKMGIKIGTEGIGKRPGARGTEPGDDEDRLKKENDVKAIAMRRLKL